MRDSATADCCHKLDWSIIQRTLVGLCQTQYGSNFIEEHRYWCQSKSEAEERYALLSELKMISEKGGQLPVGAVTSAELVLQKCNERTVLDLDDLRDMRNLLEGIRLFRESAFVMVADKPKLNEIVVQGNFPEFLFQQLMDSFESDGSLSERTYPKLSLIRNRIQEYKAKLDAELKRLLSDTSVSKMLQDEFVTQRNGRHVLPLKANFRRQFGIVHGRSQSGETLFVEPLSVIPIANGLKEAELSLEQEIHHICRDLSRRIFRAEGDILGLLQTVAKVDASVAIFKLGQKWDGVFPIIGMAGNLKIENARHPVLILQGVSVVPNSFAFHVDRPVILLSGPNAGGKTIGLKLIGLMALLVKAGIPLPAGAGAQCDFFDTIRVDIGDTQTVEAGLSTFSAKLLALKAIIADSCENSLILLDELGMGTDPSQGAAIAQAVTETLVEKGARVVVTTHFTRLKAQADVDERFQIAAAQFRSGQPTYKLDWGRIGQSYALDVASRLGLPKQVLLRARSLLSTEESSVAELAAELANRSAELEHTQKQLKEALRSAEAREQEYRQLQQDLEEKRKRIRAAVHRDFQEQVWSDYRDLQAHIKSLKSDQNIKGLKVAQKTLEGLQHPSEPFTKPRLESKKLESVRVGQVVYVPGMRSKGEVLSVSRNRVMVQVNRIRVKLRIEELAEPNQHSLQTETLSTPKLPRVSMQPSSIPNAALSTPRSDDNTCDLRGLRVDEAVTKMERFFSELIGQGMNIAYVLHGHGTGRLKAGVRTHLSDCSLVSSWRAAEYKEGGDAFTRVVLS
ncbi:MAG: endonuclease MutS2 [Myxococcota bacterium]